MLVTNAGDECWGCRAGDEWCRRWVTIVELGSGSELCPLPVCKLGPTRIAKLLVGKLLPSCGYCSVCFHFYCRSNGNSKAPMAYFGGTTNELACGLHRTHRGKLIAAVIVGKMGRLNLTGKPSGSCVARKAFTLSGRDNTKGIARVCGRRREQVRNASASSTRCKSRGRTIFL